MLIKIYICQNFKLKGTILSRLTVRFNLQKYQILEKFFTLINTYKKRKEFFF